MKLSWYTDKDGKPSAMRIAVMMATATGCIAVLGYLVAVFAGFEIDVQIAVIGGAMAGVSEISKAWQAKGGG